MTPAARTSRHARPGKAKVTDGDRRDRARHMQTIAYSHQMQYATVLSDEENAVLMARARSVRGAYRDRLRARIVLAAAAGKTNAAIARELGVCTDTVRKWRRGVAAGRPAGLKGAPPSRPPPARPAGQPAEALSLPYRPPP